jgi:hypothetical protein
MRRDFDGAKASIIDLKLVKRDKNGVCDSSCIAFQSQFRRGSGGQA